MPDQIDRRPAVFLDRDGTIVEEVGYLNHLSRLQVYPFAAAAIRRLNDAFLPVIVVTNQSGVGRGYFPESLVQEVHDVLGNQLLSSGARLDGVYYCPHSSADNCGCRKPRLGLLQRAAQEHSLDLSRSFIVGDRYIDLELAANAGARAVLVRTGYGQGELAWHSGKWRVQPHHVASDLSGAVQWILEQSR
jgi:D-glycero-D-manno-heptose 1,7-bisphosphate phosphatase